VQIVSSFVHIFGNSYATCVKPSDNRKGVRFMRSSALLVIFALVLSIPAMADYIPFNLDATSASFSVNGGRISFFAAGTGFDLFTSAGSGVTGGFCGNQASAGPDGIVRTGGSCGDSILITTGAANFDTSGVTQPIRMSFSSFFPVGDFPDIAFLDGPSEVIFRQPIDISGVLHICSLMPGFGDPTAGICPVPNTFMGSIVFNSGGMLTIDLVRNESGSYSKTFIYSVPEPSAIVIAVLGLGSAGMGLLRKYRLSR
jgi:hypothetical protein